MDKSSKLTVRDFPPETRSSASGSLIVRAEMLAVQTEDRVELVDVTARVTTFVRESGIRDGTINLWSMHTTCAVFINEAQTALHADIKRFLEMAVARDVAWLHNDPDHSDCDRVNADSHLRAMLLGHGLTLQISGGEPVLGQWQRVLVAELDGPRLRTLRMQGMGI